MAVTKTHPIKSTLKAAIDYICNPEKTDGKLLVSAYGCSVETADIEFAWTRRHAIDKGTNLGRHLIQAFQPGEVTPEQAHEIGMELAKEILGGKYEFVLTTHIDKDHVHNHLIFNAVSFQDSKCIEFEDINYQLAQPDDKTAIFEALCDMYNSFDASISVQLSLISRHANKDDFKNSITIAPQNDDFDSIRAEYTEMLRTQLERGNNGLIKTKFLTFTVEAKDIRSARARLARIETDTLNHFKVIGAAARVLDGKQRLEVLHGIFHPDGERFNFAWEWLPASGLSVKDFIAPSSFRFGDGRMFQMGGKFGAVSFLQIVAPELSDRMLADFMDAENGIIVNLHIQSIDHNEAIKTIKRKITDLDRMKIEEQKKAIRSGYDMDIIPSDLATYGGEAKNLLRDLQSRNERMFLLTLLVLNLADTKQKLDNEVFGAAAIAQKYNCILTRLDYRQEQGLMSSIPLGENLIHIQRGLTTSSTAVFVPFSQPVSDYGFSPTVHSPPIVGL